MVRWLFLLRWLLLLLGGCCLALGIYGYYTINTPRAISPAQWQEGKLPKEQAYLSLPITPDPARALYNLQANSDNRSQAVPLTSQNTFRGIPLLGAEGPPRTEWKKFQGQLVQVAGGIPDGRRVGQSSTTIWSGDRRVEFRYLAKLNAPESVWILSPTFSQTIRVSYFGDGYEAPCEEAAAWLGQTEFQGRLALKSNFPQISFRGAEDGPPAEAEPPADEWLVDTSDSYRHENERGLWHSYLPLNGGPLEVWVQTESQGKSDLAAWANLPQEKMIGVWLPPGFHQFNPAAPEKPGEKVGLVICDKAEVQVLLAQQWKNGPWRILFWVGGVLLAVGLVALLLNAIYRRHVAPRLPDFLKPFEQYIVRESPLQRLIQMVGGVLVFLVAIVFFFLALAGKDAVRRDREPGIGLAMLVVCLPTAWLLVGVSQMLWSRGAAAAMSRSTRPPILYLRSFVADTRLFDTLVDLFWMLVLPGRVETVEHSLSKAVRGVGPLVAIGKPTEPLPPMGAARLYVAHDQWQSVVERLVKSSQFVILRIGKTKSFWWELQHVVQSCNPGKVLIYFPPQDRDETYALLRDAARSILPRPLPDYPFDAYFIGFGPDWSVRFYVRNPPRLISMFRQLVIGSPAPLIRDSLNAAMAELKMPTRGMPLQAREWFLVSLPFLLVVALGVIFILVTSPRGG